MFTKFSNLDLTILMCMFFNPPLIILNVGEIFVNVFFFFELQIWNPVVVFLLFVAVIFFSIKLKYLAYLSSYSSKPGLKDVKKKTVYLYFVQPVFD